MASAMDLRLVNDLNLEALLKSRNFKQGLKNIDKKLKKDPGDIRWLVTRACVLYEIEELQEAHRICEDVALRKPPIIDIEHIIAICQLIALLSSRNRILTCATLVEQLWQNAIATQDSTSAKRVFVEEWLDQSVELSLWASVAKMIGSQQEFLLLKKVMRNTRKDDKLLDFLSQTRLGPECQLSQDIWGLTRCRLELMEDNQHWQDLWELSRALLLDALHIDARWQSDNWQFWAYLLNSHRAALHASHTDQFQDLVKESGASVSSSRSAQRALLLLNDKNKPDDALVESNVQYFQKNCIRPVCASDLVLPLSTLSMKQYTAFRDRASLLLRNDFPQDHESQLEWITAQANLLQLDFEMMKRQAEKQPSRSPRSDNSEVIHLISSFTSSCIELYRISRQHTKSLSNTDLNPGDESCILAARGLILMWDLTQRHDLVLQAACLLTFLVETSAHNASARLILVNLMQYLGLFSLAIRAYRGLKVRGILNETCCPALFTRLSAMFPWTSRKEVDVTMDLDKALKFYDDSILQVPQYQQLALHKRNYASVVSMGSFSTRLQDSLTREMLTQERRRLGRVTGKDFGQCRSSQVLHDFATTKEAVIVKDTRLISDFPVLTKAYVSWADYVGNVFEAAASSRAVNPQELYSMRSTDGVRLDDLVQIEREALELAKLVQQVLRGVAQDKLDMAVIGDSLASVDHSLGKITRIVLCRPSQFGVELLIPRWDLYYSSHVALECLSVIGKLIDKVIGHVGEKAKKSQREYNPQIDNISKALRSNLEISRRDIKTQAFDIKQAMEKQWSQQEHELSALCTPFTDASHGQDETICHPIEKLLGHQNIARILDIFVESSRESLGAIASVRKA
ncbi:MAG: hypothetical protein M1828_006735 [Chrysothrix sp. TS-e1954]|nr:MAG: hypothetical protein M1828_006735 [Chrysothrix sp. TS-e1954]